MRDSQQQFGVQTAALEDMIHVGPFAIEIAGEPCDGSLLTVQFVLYQFADVYHTPVLCKYLLIVGYVVGNSDAVEWFIFAEVCFGIKLCDSRY